MTVRRIHSLLLALALLVLSVACSTAPPQRATISPKDLLPLVGKWTGSLTYLDYQDNQTEVTLHTVIEYKMENERLNYTVEFVEPSGKIVNGSGFLQIPLSQTLLFDGTAYSLVSVDRRGKKWNEMRLTTTGKDNNRPATIERTLTLDDSELILETRVTYTGQANSFVRNTYRFRKNES